MSRLLSPFEAYPGGGGVLTFVGTAPNQAVYWELVSYNPVTQSEGPPLGSLMWEVTLTDMAFKSTNGYVAPDNDPGDGSYDRVKVSCAL